MGKATSLSNPSSLQCFLFRKQITSLGGIASVGTLKIPFANEYFKYMQHDGSDKVQQTLHDSCKDEFLRMGKDLLSSFVGEDSGNKGSASWFSSFPDEVQTYMKDMENQIRKLRGENFEFKQVISHLFSLIQATNSEVRSNSSKIAGQVASLEETLEKGCACSINLDAKFIAVHSSVKVLEAKIDSMRAKIRKSTMDLQGGIRGSAGGNEGTNVDILHQ